MGKIKIPARPKTDADFLELIARIIFVIGFNWKIVEHRWPLIRKSFNGFDIGWVKEQEVEDLVNEEGVIRNRKKIGMVIENAEICGKIIAKHGSMREWVKRIDKEQEESPLLAPSLQDEFRVFRGIGEKTSGWLAHVSTKEKDGEEVIYRE